MWRRLCAQGGGDVKKRFDVATHRDRDRPTAAAVGCDCRGARGDSRGSPETWRAIDNDFLATAPHLNDESPGLPRQSRDLPNDVERLALDVSAHRTRERATAARDPGSDARVAASDAGLARNDRRRGRTRSEPLGTDAAIAGSHARLARNGVGLGASGAGLDGNGAPLGRTRAAGGSWWNRIRRRSAETRTTDTLDPRHSPRSPRLQPARIRL